MGDYTFDPKFYPDPAAMVQHLQAKGVRLMVSAWPFVDAVGARGQRTPKFIPLQDCAARSDDGIFRVNTALLTFVYLLHY